MASTKEEIARLTDSPELAEFHKVLAMFSYNALSYVSAGTNTEEKISRALYATGVATAGADLLSPPGCGAGCYWDPETGTCVCSGFNTLAKAAMKKAGAKRKTSRKTEKPSKKKKKLVKAKKG